MTINPPGDKFAGYRLAARDLASGRFDRSSYDNRLWLLLGCMAVLGAFSVAVSAIFGAGTTIARILAVPEILIFLVLTWLLITDYVRRVASSPLWDRD